MTKLCYINNCQENLKAYSGWTMSMDFTIDRCLQSIPQQSHSVDADWIVKYSRATPTCV